MQVVRHLRAAGVENTFGLVDRDTKQSTANGIVTMGGAERYAVENFLLDPLLVALLIVRGKLNCSVSRPSLGLSESGTWGNIDFTDSAALQRLADAVLGAVGPPPEAPDVTLIDVHLHGGSSLHLPNWFLQEQGHSWANRLFARLPCLKGEGRDADSLMLKVIDHVVSELPDMVSAVFFASIRTLYE